MSTYLYLQSPKENKPSLIMLRIREGNQQIKVSTKVKCLPCHWDSEKQAVTSEDQLHRYKNLALQSWVTEADRAVLKAEDDGYGLDFAKEILLHAKGCVVGKRDKSNSFLIYYYKWATTQTKAKRILKQQDLTTWRILKEFRERISFDDVDMKFYEDFCRWMDEVKNYRANTEGTQIKNLKAAMNAAYKEGLHTNTAYLNFKKPQEEVDNVYLTQAELDALYALPLSGYKEKARDIFLVGCYTAMRWSDFSRLQEKDITGDTIYFTHKKTGYRVSIPLHPIVREIIDKYGGKVPALSEQKLNKYIKEVCRDAGMTQFVTKVFHKGGGRTEEVREKCDLVSSHTARRTAATNMYISGVPAYNIMLITGHTSEATFRKYIKFEKERNAELMRDNPYFKKSK